MLSKAVDQLEEIIFNGVAVENFQPQFAASGGFRTPKPKPKPELEPNPNPNPNNVSFGGGSDFVFPTVK